MNKFLQRLFWEEGGRYKPKSPLLKAFNPDINFEYEPLQRKTLFNLKLNFNLEAWVDGNKERDERLKHEIMTNTVKRLHYEIFGEIESLLGELKIHLFNEDFAGCIETVQLIDQAIRGEN